MAKTSLDSVVRSEVSLELPDDSLIIKVERPSVNALFEGTFWDMRKSSYFKAVYIDVCKGTKSIYCSKSGVVLRFVDTTDFKSGIVIPDGLLENDVCMRVRDLADFPGIVLPIANKRSGTYLPSVRALCLEDGRVFVDERILMTDCNNGAYNLDRCSEYLRNREDWHSGVGFVAARQSEDYVNGHLQALTYGVLEHILNAKNRKRWSDLFYSKFIKILDDELV